MSFTPFLKIRPQIFTLLTSSPSVLNFVNTIPPYLSVKQIVQLTNSPIRPNFNVFIDFEKVHMAMDRGSLMPTTTQGGYQGRTWASFVYVAQTGDASLDD